MQRKYTCLVSLLTLVFVNAYSQTVETINEVTITNTPSVCYIVNNQGKIVPGVNGVVIKHSARFFMKASTTYFNSPSPNKNFVRTEVYKPGAFDNNGTWNLPVFPKHKIYEYFDGLGTLRQTIDVGQSPSKKDLVTFNHLDGFGRIARTYLPYTKQTGGMFRDSILREQEKFYRETEAVPVEAEAFGYNIYDNSPQNNIRNVFSVGWQWHNAPPSTNNVRVNGALDLRKLVLNSAGLPAYVDGQFYPKGVFTVTETSDESGLVTKTFRDLNDRIVVERKGKGSTWLDTYYLYDISGNLKYVFPPEASSRLLKFSGTLDKQLFLDLWCFQFRYDKYGRLIEKKVPGSAWVYYIYDQWDRRVLSQDGNQRENNQWTFTKYDIHNRPIMTGVITAVRTAAEADAMKSQNRFENRARNSIGYTNQTYPAHSEASLLTITYYDCYQFLSYPSWDTDGVNFYPVIVDGIVNTSQLLFQLNATSTTLPVVRGYTTGTKVRVLDQGTTRWLNNVVFYNRQYQAVQTISENYAGGYDISSTLYDKFSDVVYKRRRFHSTTTRSVTVDDEYVVDTKDRLLKAYQTIDGKQKVLMVSNRYNELGQLTEKNIHSTDEQKFLQSIDHRYNIQGWLTHINNSSLTNDKLNNDDLDDLFGMEIVYNDPVRINNGTFKPLAFYDGNIAAIKWKTNTQAPGVAPQERIYGFEYDAFKRFTKSYYATGPAPLWNGNAGLFNESVVAYDANGNIGGSGTSGLVRNGRSDNVSAQIDNLHYGYVGNQLRNVRDNSLHKSGFSDKPGVDASVAEFEYDANGNLIFDLNRSISAIVYNHLNLPKEIEFTRESPLRTDRIVYIYDALGNKLQRDVFVGNSRVWSTQYIQGFQYDNGTLSFLTTSEGRAVFDGTDFSYEYFLKDHQKNTRVVCGLLKETNVFLATMETPLDNLERNNYGFANITESRVPGNNITRATEKVLTPDKSARCNGYSTTTVKAFPVGPAKRFKVGAGDVIYTEVFSRFNNAKTNTSTILPAVLGSFVTSAFKINSTEHPILYNRVDMAARVIASGKTYAAIVPKGYLAVLFIDDNNNLVFSSAQSISEKSFKAFEKLAVSFKTDRAGEVFIYVANESSSGASIDVYFDDLYLIHEKNQFKPQVIQASDYYPFGLSFNEYSKDRLRMVKNGTTIAYEPMVRNRYLFQGQELQQDLDLGWYQFRFRMHDPSIGRFASVDPLAEKYPYWSPYSFSGNQLMNAVELEGAEPRIVTDTWKMFSPVAFKFDFSFTSHNSKIGVNVSLGLPKALPFSYRREFGASYNFSDLIQGNAVAETRSSIETSYLMGLVSFKSTTYNSSGYSAVGDPRSTSQTTGMVTLGGPFANIAYENDFHPQGAVSFLNPFNFHPKNGGDGSDRFRTAALSYNVGVFSGGFKLATGDPGPYRDESIDQVGGRSGTYILNQYRGKTYDPNRYRLGLAYLSIGNFQIGMNDEAIRHQIQNRWTHDNLRNSPWFQVMPYNNELYFGFSNGSTTQW